MDVVDYLCEHVVTTMKALNVDYECSRNGLTAFAKAALSGHYEIASVILEKGQADKNYVNKKEGKSIVELAIEHSLHQQLDYLINHAGVHYNDM